MADTSMTLPLGLDTTGDSLDPQKHIIPSRNQHTMEIISAEANYDRWA